MTVQLYNINENLCLVKRLIISYNNNNFANYNGKHKISNRHYVFTIIYKIENHFKIQRSYVYKNFAIARNWDFAKKEKINRRMLNNA